jgi:nitroimidazol reductase NimA-like FMN-containing flavoprotein (pyridoxamine 5'-phosphate oxidase superfamily)
MRFVFRSLIPCLPIPLMSASTSIISLEDKDLQFLNSMNVARLATTIDKRNRPHVVPIIYAFDKENGKFYPTTFKGTKKLRNMQQNKSVSIVVDEYSKSAKKRVMFSGIAETINPNKNEFQRAVKVLTDKLAYYKKNPISPDKSEVISIRPVSSSKWELPPD